MNFTKLFGLPEQHNFGSLFAALERLLEGHSESELQFITGLSGLLGKVAYSDKEISSEELAFIKKVICQELPLKAGQFEDILQLISKHARDLSGIEDHHYWQLINSTCSKQERIEVLRSLFGVAAANQSISNDEERELRIIAKGLNIMDEDYKSVRTSYREFIDILKAT